VIPCSCPCRVLFVLVFAVDVLSWAELLSHGLGHVLVIRRNAHCDSFLVRRVDNELVERDQLSHRQSQYHQLGNRDNLKMTARNNEGDDMSNVHCSMSASGNTARKGASRHMLRRSSVVEAQIFEVDICDRPPTNMFAQFQNSYRRMEESLQRLTDSIAAYNPSPTAADDLLAADDIVNEDLERCRCS
jgi:UDP-N-acetylmuramate-alanine ligase